MGSRLSNFRYAFSLGEHVGGNALIPANRLFISRLADVCTFISLRDEFICDINLFSTGLVVCTDLDTIIGPDKRPAGIGKTRLIDTAAS